MSASKVSDFFRSSGDRLSLKFKKSNNKTKAEPRVVSGLDRTARNNDSANDYELTSTAATASVEKEEEVPKRPVKTVFGLPPIVSAVMNYQNRATN